MANEEKGQEPEQPTPEGQMGAQEGLTSEQITKAKELKDEQNRPIYNRLRELERKNVELQEQLAEREADTGLIQPSPPSAPSPANKSGFSEDQWVQLEERYPDLTRAQIQGVLEIANAMDETRTAVFNKELNLLKLETAKTKLRAQKPDFEELEAEIDKRLKSLPATVLNSNTLEEAYYYVKGKKAEKERPAGQGSQVLGVLPSTGTTKVAGSQPTLTKEQHKRMIEMGLSNPQDFLDIQKQRQTRRQKK